MKRVLLFLTLSLLVVLSGCSNSAVRDGVDTKKAAAANADLGLRYMLQGNNELALSKLRRSLEFDSRYGPAHHYIAELYRRLDRPEDAGKHFQQAVRYHEGEDTNLFNNYGAFLCSHGDYAAGEKQFLRVLENPVYPRPDQVYENLGLCMEGKPDLEKAEEYLRKALQINPRLPKSLLAMARISLENENHLSARAYLQRYQAVARPTPESLWLGIRVERVLGDKDALASYGLMLKGNYPNAEETKLYLESN
ncbi:MAG: type IV pilus biogenesis/stability protein PilW [Gammaproteobacteria bacterium]|nr:type IV pilus biogenesis/stability protein PilW [Gammaproteobacteria bacterium]